MPRHRLTVGRSSHGMIDAHAGNMVVDDTRAIACPQTAHSRVACSRRMACRHGRSSIVGGVLLLIPISLELLLLLLLGILRLGRRHIVLVRRVPLMRHVLSYGQEPRRSWRESDAQPVIQVRSSWFQRCPCQQLPGWSMGRRRREASSSVASAVFRRGFWSVRRLDGWG